MGQAVIELTDRRVLDPDRPLEGTRWVVSAMIGANVMGYSAGPGRAFLVFGQGQVTGSDGCQPLSGPAAVSGPTVGFGSGPAAASSPCTDPAAANLALRVRATLQGDVGYRIEADELTLSGTDPEGRSIGLVLTAASQSSPL